MHELRVLCWDHPRCTSPMSAAATEWPGLRWDARPLAAFNDQPIEAAVRGYDLVVLDHPLIAETVSAEDTPILPLDDLLPPGVLDALAADSIGGSHDSYRYDGAQWATAIDAACQVSVVRGETPPPETWADVMALARAGRVGLPLYPSDAFCALVSLSTEGIWDEAGVERLVEVARLADDRSYDWNPPAMLDLMAKGEGPDCAPLVFGYAAYEGPLRFSVPPCRSVLGGAGLAVVASSDAPEEAARFAAWFAGADVQRRIVREHGGQPVARSAWTGGFFDEVRPAMERAYVRPREPWWPRFQAEAGVRLVELLRAGNSVREIHRTLTEIGDRHREGAL